MKFSFNKSVPKVVLISVLAAAGLSACGENQQLNLESPLGEKVQLPIFEIPGWWFTGSTVPSPEFAFINSSNYEVGLLGGDIEVFTTGFHPGNMGFLYEVTSPIIPSPRFFVLEPHDGTYTHTSTDLVTFHVPPGLQDGTQLILHGVKLTSYTGTTIDTTAAPIVLTVRAHIGNAVFEPNLEVCDEGVPSSYPQIPGAPGAVTCVNGRPKANLLTSAQAASLGGITGLDAGTFEVSNGQIAAAPQVEFAQIIENNQASGLVALAMPNLRRAGSFDFDQAAGLLPQIPINATSIVSSELNGTAVFDSQLEMAPGVFNLDLSTMHGLEAVRVVASFALEQCDPRRNRIPNAFVNICAQLIGIFNPNPLASMPLVPAVGTPEFDRMCRVGVATNAMLPAFQNGCNTSGSTMALSANGGPSDQDILAMSQADRDQYCIDLYADPTMQAHMGFIPGGGGTYAGGCIPHRVATPAGAITTTADSVETRFAPGEEHPAGAAAQSASTSISLN